MCCPEKATRRLHDMSAIEVQGLVKRMSKTLVIDDVSFKVEDGEFLVLLGPSGSGKTTILRLISGLLMPDAGRILINGQDVTQTDPATRNVGMVFQDFALYPHLNVYNNIGYGLDLRGMGRDEISMRVWAAAEKLELQPLLERSIEGLSGGEKRRVALAHVLVKNADIYLFDEPLVNLDPRLRFEARQEMMLVHRIKQKATIYITQQQIEAFNIAHRVAVIIQGKLLQIGTREELLYKPVNVPVARFIGSPSINILTAHIQHNDMRYTLYGDGIYFTLPSAWRTILEQYPHPTVLVGFRPDTVIPEWAFPSLDRGSCFFTYAQVIYIEPRAEQNVVALRMGVSSEIVALFNNRRDIKLVRGQVINIAIPSEHLYLFDPSTELLLDKARLC
jgi:multiple sugar transport system ATP-binding protein